MAGDIVTAWVRCAAEIGIHTISGSSNRFTQGGRTTVKTALYLAALSAARYHPDFTIFYAKLKTAGKPAKVALIAVARKLLIMLNGIARNVLKTP